MGSISQLSYTDTIDDSTSFPVSQNGQDLQALVGALKTWLDANATDRGWILQYAAPQATGFSVSISDTTGADGWLILTPAAGYANGTINLPSAENSFEGQEIKVNCTKAVTTLDILSSGASVVGHPTTLTANGYFTMKYEPVLKTWYRVG